MRDDSVPHSIRPNHPESFSRVHAALIRYGYALISEDELPDLSGVRDYLKPIFTEGALKAHSGDTPADRKRAMDVVKYERQDDGSVSLIENDTIMIRRRDGSRDNFTRIKILERPCGSQFISTALSLVPPCWQQRNGTFGVDLLRTYSNVVTKPHQENFCQFLGIWVIEKNCGGAETYLYDLFSPGKLIVQHNLAPGEIIIFNDALFLHGTTPLEPTNGISRRDAANFTFHFPGLY